MDQAAIVDPEDAEGAMRLAPAVGGRPRVEDPQSGHQATQVSPAQQRPANGAPPPATQASAKQSANGKEDDEDWWTE